MWGILLASAMVCTVTRNADNSCVQRCENGNVTVQKYIKRCPETEEEKALKHQRMLEQQQMQLMIQEQRTRQMEALERMKQQEVKK